MSLSTNRRSHSSIQCTHPSHAINLPNTIYRARIHLLLRRLGLQPNPNQLHWTSPLGYSPPVKDNTSNDSISHPSSSPRNIKLPVRKPRAIVPGTEESFHVLERTELDAHTGTYPHKRGRCTLIEAPEAFIRNDFLDTVDCPSVLSWSGRRLRL